MGTLQPCERPPLTPPCKGGECVWWVLPVVFWLLLNGNLHADDPATRDIGSRLELLVDDYLIDKTIGVELKLHSPTAREVVLLHDQPWEGSGCGYHTVFQDGDIFRMYYTSALLTNQDGTQLPSRTSYSCYAESKDGIHWVKPELGLFEFKGSQKNNIIWEGTSAHDFSPYKDTNPNCAPDAKYKCVALGNGGLVSFKSADALHWSPLSEKPLITQGKFDTENLAFWDNLRGHYWAYIRDFHNGIRDIRVSTSKDFATWTEPEILKFVDSPDEQLYTNQIIPYYRAPHIFVGFPTRYTERPWSPAFKSLPDLPHRERRVKFSPRYGTAVTDGLFMSSRDGRTFKRWGEAFIRPGIERKDNWIYGDGYQNWGIIETKSDDEFSPQELSVFAVENNWKDSCRLRRYTLRVDGFLSAQAPLKGGEFVTRPLTFTGKELVLNFSTSGAGSIRVEIQDAAGKPLPGFALADCLEVFGDSLQRVVEWSGGADVSKLAKQPVRLKSILKDADIYSLQFRDAK